MQLLKWVNRMKDMYDVFTKDGEYLGTRPLTEFNKDNPEFYFKIVWIILLNENDEILIQKRSDNLEVCPGKWEISASGHVDSGENELDAAVRETKEEVGVSLDKNNIKLIKRYIHKDAITDTYIARIRNNTNITLQKEEVADAKWISLYEFKNLIYTDDFVPRDREYYEFLLNYLIVDLKIDDRNIIKRNNNESLSKSMDKIENDDNVKEGIELESSLKIIDFVITILILLLIGIVIYCVLK